MHRSFRSHRERPRVSSQARVPSQSDFIEYAIALSELDRQEAKPSRRQGAVRKAPVAH